MTIHVSLPQELENLVHAQVETGMYNSASEVVREALRRFFGGGDTLTPQEVTWLREVIAPRLEAVRHGAAPLTDGDAFFDAMERRFSE